MKRRYIGTGEMLAIESGALQRGAEGFFWALSDDPILVNRRHSAHPDVAIVTVRGSLEHHATCASDSYEGIRERLRMAFEGKDVEEGETPTPPSAVILDIDSRGGVVAGLNECVADLQAMRKRYGIPLIAVLNEMAASAAFALACAADKRYSPASGIAGSIGTISTMVSQTAKDVADGIDVRLLTSGARKSDGHPHTPITDAAVKAEQGRVDELAASFFRLAGKALGVSPAKLQALQAGIYLGPAAKKHGLIDDVRSLDQVAAGLSRPVEGGAEAKGNETKRLAATPNDAPGQRTASKVLDAPRRAASPSPTGARMKLSVRLMAIAASIAGETDPTKRSSLIRLSARKAATLAAKAEKGDDDPEDDEDDEDDDEDESKSQKAAKKAEAAKKAAKAAGHRAKAAEYKKKAEEAEEAAKAAEDDEEDDDEAAARAPAGGARADASTEILASQAGMATEALARVQALEARAAERDRQATIAKLVAERRVTPGEAKKWASRSASFWGQVEEMRPKALVAVSEEMLETPDNTPAADLPANVRAMVEQGVRASGLTGKAADDLREKSFAAHRTALMQSAGGTH